MNVHLINPSSVSFGTAVITPRWQYVLAAATPKTFGDPILVDETLFQMDAEQIQPGDAVGIGIHTANALRGYEIGKIARERGAYVIFGGIHATLYPQEAIDLGGAHAVVKGDGDIAWARALEDCRADAGQHRPASHLGLAGGQVAGPGQVGGGVVDGAGGGGALAARTGGQGRSGDDRGVPASAAKLSRHLDGACQVQGKEGSSQEHWKDLVTFFPL